jgi:hypothetical protein
LLFLFLFLLLLLFLLLFLFLHLLSIRQSLGATPGRGLPFVGRCR